jgi:hypothetical protein
MKLAIHDISVSGPMIDSESTRLRVEYTPEGGDTTIDYGNYNIKHNTYWPGLDTDGDKDNWDEYESLQLRVEGRG